jgi:hypothetical protein
LHGFKRRLGPVDGDGDVPEKGFHTNVSSQLRFGSFLAALLRALGADKSLAFLFF